MLKATAGALALALLATPVYADGWLTGEQAIAMFGAGQQERVRQTINGAARDPQACDRIVMVGEFTRGGIVKIICANFSEWVFDMNVNPPKVRRAAAAVK